MFAQLKRNEGQELVEYAFVFIMLMTLILGIIEFGVIVFTQNSMSNVAREGARWAVVRRTNPNPNSYLPPVDSSIEERCDSPNNAIDAMEHVQKLWLLTLPELVSPSAGQTQRKSQCRPATLSAFLWPFRAIV